MGTRRPTLRVIAAACALLILVVVISSLSKGQDAIDRACSTHPDLMISDVIFKNETITGIDVAIQVRKSVPECKILLFSGQAATADLLTKVAYSSDAFGSPELQWVAGRKGREALSSVLTEAVDADKLSPEAARTAARLIFADNARAIYGL